MKNTLKNGQHIAVQASPKAEKALKPLLNYRAAIKDMFFDQAMKEVVKRYKPQKIIQFGSWAWGEANKDSDIDLLIIKRTPKNFVERYAEVRKIFRKYMPVMPMDIIVLTPEELKKNLNGGNDFIRKVMEEGEVLFDGKRRFQRP